jgi:hypothetical protein
MSYTNENHRDDYNPWDDLLHRKSTSRLHGFKVACKSFSDSPASKSTLMDLREPTGELTQRILAHKPECMSNLFNGHLSVIMIYYWLWYQDMVCMQAPDASIVSSNVCLEKQTTLLGSRFHALIIFFESILQLFTKTAMS